MAKYKIELNIRETFHVTIEDACSEADARAQARGSVDGFRKAQYDERFAEYEAFVKLVNQSTDVQCIDTAEAIMERISALGIEAQVAEVRRQALFSPHFLTEPVVQKWILANTHKIMDLCGANLQR